MNYEELYSQLQPLEKRMKEIAASLQKTCKAIEKNTESGDLKNLSRELAAFSELLSEETALATQIQELAEGFDAGAYLDSGEFTEQMLELCKEQGVDVNGDYPVFEIFPYRLRIDTENHELYLDRKKLQCMRPSSLVQTVKSGRERMMKASFNAQSFLNELADAYDLAALKQNKASGADLYLTNLYKLLVPMGRFRRDYDQQSFAYDLARLYASDVETTKTGRRFQFGPSRNNNKAIRILDQEGKEQFLATIRFF